MTKVLVYSMNYYIKYEQKVIFMYEEIAWNNFCKTGNLESFLEYKKIKELNSRSIEMIKDEGIIIDELNKSKRDSN